MSTQQKIRDAVERQHDAFEKRPTAASGTGKTTVRLTGGMTCEVEQGDWRFVADQPESNGGDNLGPDPGLFGRAAYGVCAAQSYAKWFALRGLPLRTIEVRVESDMDARGSMALDQAVHPGYQRMRALVTIESDAEEAAIMETLDHADRHSPWHDNFTRALPVSRQVTIKKPSE